MVQNEKDQKMINLWNMLGKQPDHFLQPGRALLQIYVAEVSPAILQSNDQVPIYRENCFYQKYQNDYRSSQNRSLFLGIYKMCVSYIKQI